MSDSSELIAHLQCHGLDDAEFWVSQLKQLGVMSKASLQLLEGDQESVSELEKKARHQVEKTALHRLLDIDDLKSKKKIEKEQRKKEEAEQRNKEITQKLEKEKQELEYRYNEAQKVINELDKARTEGKKRQDSRIEKLESDMRSLLQVSSGAWIAEDKSLDELIKSLRLYHDMSADIQEREWLNETVILQKCSGGKVLRGVLLTKNLADQLEDREYVLELPDEVNITNAAICEETIEAFSSSKEEHNYKKAVEILGCSVAVSASAPVYGDVAIKVGTAASKNKKDEAAHEDHKKGIYSSTVKYCTMHVGSCSFKKSDLKLAKDAKHDLAELSKIIEIHGEGHNGVYEKCERFFHTYGSHITSGPFSFGGHFWWTCSTNGFSESEKDIVSKMQKEAIVTTPGISFLGFGASIEANIEKTKEKYKGKFKKDALATTKLQLKITGGPPEATEVTKWKKGLVTYNSTWVLTDRGKKMISVWDIIKINHDKEFGHLKSVLKSSWEKMTGLKAIHDLIDLLPNSEYELELVSTWNEENDLTAEEILDRLYHLMKVKKEIVQKTGDLRHWISAYITQPAVQTFLISVMNAKLESSSIEKLKFTIKQLIEKKELRQLNTLNFPQIQKFSQWLYSTRPHAVKVQEEITDFQSFDNFVDKTLRNALMPGSSPVSHEKLAQIVQKGVNYLQLHCRSTYKEILVTVLMYPYQYSFDKTVRLKPLSVLDLKMLKEQFYEQTKKFKIFEGEPFKLQCYLFLLAMEYSNKKNFRNLILPISQMMKEVNPPLKPELSDHIERYMNAGFLKLKTSLSMMLSGELYPIPHPFSCSSDSLKQVLQTKCRSQYELFHEDIPPLQSNINAHILLEKLELSKYYPKQLGMQDALCIRPKILKLSLSDKSPTELKDLPYLVLHKLLSYDTKCRSDLMHAATKKQNSQSYSSDSDSASEEEQEKEVQIYEGNEIYSNDCLLALILCSDDFLCQDLFSRLAKCQLAIPFLLPDPFTKQLNLSLWAMCSIVKEWKVKKENDDVEEHTHPIVKYPMPIVSFIRFGEHQHRGASKSRIVNEIISDSNHDFFFHRDCPGGQYNRILGEGLVDICWYLPTGKADDAFPDAVAFLNLHGNASNHPDQTRFLSQISSMCFVLVTKENLNFEGETIEILEKFNSSLGGVTILNDTKKDTKKLKKEFSSLKLHFTDLTSKTAYQIKHSIRQRINSKWETIKSSNAIKNLCVDVASDNIHIDQNCTSFQAGMLHTKKLTAIIADHKHDKLSTKEAMLPLQGEKLWKAWAALDKELHRQNQRGKENMEIYEAHIQEQKDVIRKEQLKFAKSLTPLMETFIISLLNLGGPDNKISRNYFLQCLKLELNNLSRVSISKIQNQYQSARKELSSLQPKSDDNEIVADVQKQIDQLKKKLEDLQEDLINFSFGLEHLLRELSQVYEAAMKSNGCKDSISRLPQAAAELLIDGYPIEVMDGDAAHVPLQWVTAVLNEAVTILGDPKVFVLSVLGLQSTGKSTLLNTMFGVQFNVSAGRCTRGAFMQLLPFDDEMKAKTQCSHILIVDTEGLRAPELDPLKTQKHDNELATFVIGLANMTLINIYGEVAGDMNDILQTSVHAFLRMTEVKYHPSCKFVHQNAGANTKSEVGRAKLVQKLDQFTLQAAKEEKCEGLYKSFDDVIHFNDQKDASYFQGLWKGDPPMAPVNQGYSNEAQKLKQQIVETVEKESYHLSSFQGRAEDLWNALLKEKFVFSFKNTLEITAYRSLETAFSKWAWTFQESMLKWEQTAGNEINTEPDASVTQLVEQKLEEMRAYAVKELYEPLKIEMEEFFNGKQSEILVQWKANFQYKFENVSAQLIMHAEKHCTQLLSRRQAISTFQEARKKDANFIKGKVRQHIEKVRQEQEELNQSLEKRDLQTDQLKKLLKRNLLTSEKLALYKSKQIITPDQERKIIDTLRENQLSEDSLKKILVGGIITVDQVKMILKTARETEHELKFKFEAIWMELINQLPPMMNEPIRVEHEVLQVLISHIQRYEGQLIGKLQEIKLRKWGPKLELIVKKNIHFHKVTSRLKRGVEYVSRKWHGTEDPYEIDARDATEKIFNEVEKYLQTTTKKDANFNSAFVKEMLILMDDQITNQSSLVKDRFNFTLAYVLEMYLVACSYSLPLFERMANLFTERNDPLIYLEVHVRGPLFTMFKNLYYQTKGEEAVANSLCAYLKEPIKEQVKESIGPLIVGMMKGSEQFFSSKMALKVKILNDLQEKNEFKSSMCYVRTVKKCLEEHIKNYTITFCDKKASDGNTRLQLTAKSQVTSLIHSVEKVVTYVNEENIEDWLSSFCNNKEFRSSLGVILEPKDMLCNYDSTDQQLDLDNFKALIREGLQELKVTLHALYDNIQSEDEMENWAQKPHEFLNSLIGCTAQCPFCGEQCDLLDPQHYEQTGQKHQTEIHRINCLAGWRYKETNVMATEFCPAEVDSTHKFYKFGEILHPYSKYQEVYPDWSIPPDKTAQSSLYWKWFVGKYPEELAEEFEARPPNVPSQWKAIEWEEVRDDLKKIYKL